VAWHRAGLGLIAIIVASTPLGWSAGAYGSKGALDPDFGRRGLVFEPKLPPAADAIVAPSGSIETAAIETMPGRPRVPAVVVVARYLPSGRFDKGFGHHGVAEIPINRKAPDRQVRDLRVTNSPDGHLNVVFGFSSSKGHHMTVARLLPNGRREQTFGGGDGVLILPKALDAGVDSQGRVAYLTNDALIRVLADGSVDPGFGSGGTAAPPPGGRIPQELEIGADDSITVVEPSGLGGVARYLPNGSLDYAFGDGGLAPQTNNGVEVDELRLSASGAVFFADTVFGLKSGGVIVEGFTASGEPIGEADFPGWSSFAPGTAEDVFLVGSEDGSMVLGRLSAGLTFDRRLGHRGHFDICFGRKQASASAVAVGADGSVVLAGGADKPGKAAPGQALARVLPAAGGGGTETTCTPAGT
jgi:hypothetical protein